MEGEFDRVEEGLGESTGLFSFLTATGSLEDGVASEVGFAGAGWGREIGVILNCGLGLLPARSLCDLLRLLRGLIEPFVSV